MRHLPEPLSLVLAAASLSLGAGVCSASAEEWLLKSSIAQRSEYNTNVRLLPGTDRAWSLVTSPRFSLSRQQQNTELTANGQADLLRFPGHSEFNAVNEFGGLTGKYDGERSTLSLSGNFSHESMRTAQLAEVGRVRSAGFRRAFDVGPSWELRLTDRDLLTVSGSYENTAYTSHQLVGYHAYYASATLSHSSTPRLNLVGTVSGTRYASDDTLHSRSNIASAQFGFTYAINHTWKLSAMGGGRYAHTDETLPGGWQFAPPKSTPFGSVFQVGADYDTVRTKLHVIGERTFDPSGFGRPIERTRVSLTGTYRLSRYWLLDWDTRYQLTSGNEAGSTKRNYASGSAGVRWLISRSLYARIAYRFRYRRLQGESSHEDAHIVTVGLTYNFDQKRL